MTRFAVLAATLAVVLTALPACSSRDETKDELATASARIATLEAKLATAVAVTPTPFGSPEYCKRVEEWQTAVTAAEKLWDDSIAQNTFPTTSAQLAISDAYRRAWAVVVPAPPSGNDDAARLSELLVASKAYSEQLLRATTASLAAQQEGSGATAKQVFDAQVKQQAFLLENDSVSVTISKLLGPVCGIRSTLRGRIR